MLLIVRVRGTVRRAQVLFDSARYAESFGGLRSILGDYFNVLAVPEWCVCNGWP